jgi:hypothetical protein
MDKKVIQDLERFLNEHRADVLALDAIVKGLITRLAKEGEMEQLLDAFEQQSLQTVSLCDPRHQAMVKPKVHEFFESLRQWHKKEKTKATDSGSVH